jgi:hypothetical protein
MDHQRQQILWTIALKNYQAAVLTAQHGWHNVSVTRSYYAVFIAMWLALDDPPKGRWEHGGIVEQFVYGQWRTPPMPIARDLTRAIRRLYADRVRLASLESTTSLTTARQVVRLVADALGFSLGGISL